MTLPTSESKRRLEFPASIERWTGLPLGLAIVMIAAAIALHICLFVLELWPSPRPLWGDEATYWNAARTLATSGVWDLDPLWPPLYPRLLSWGLLLGFGRTAFALVQLALLFAAAGLLGAMAGRVAFTFLGDRKLARRAGFLAAWFLVSDPQVASFAHYFWPEIPHLFLTIVAAWLFFRHVDRLRALALAGVSIGLALGLKFLLWPVVPIAQALIARTPRRGALGLSVFSVVVLGASVAGGWRGDLGFAIEDSARFNAWVGLNDVSRRSLEREIVGDEFTLYRASAPDDAGRSVVLGQKIRAKFEAEGALGILGRQLARQPFRLFDRESFFSAQLPGGAITRRDHGYASVSPALATLLRTWGTSIYLAVLALGTLGLVVILGRGDSAVRGLTWAVISFIAFQLAMFVILHIKSRYRVPMMPGFALFAGVALASFADTLAALERPRRLVAAAAISLAIFFALGGPLVDLLDPLAPSSAVHSEVSP